MAESVKHDYEVSGAPLVTIRVSYARLADVTPTPSNPAKITGKVAGKEATGVILTLDAAKSHAIIDRTPGNVYLMDVRNVLTYSGVPAEATFGVLNEGDPVFYDDTATMPAGVYLSTSPLAGGGAANSLFGHVVLKNAEDTLPTAVATAATASVAVMIVGAGQ